MSRLLHFAITGGETPLGRELQEQIDERKIPARVTLVGTQPGISAVLGGGNHDEAAATILGSLDAEIESVDVLFLCGDAQSSNQAFAIWQESEAKPLIIELTGALEDLPMARLAAPGERFNQGEICVIPHAAAWVITKVFESLPSPPRHAVINVLEPASERGQDGLMELQQQSTSLLNFKPLDKRVFDAQIGFAVLPRYGSAAPTKLEDVEQRIDRHLATLFGKPPLPSLRLIQVPVFHGYALSIWLEFENNPGVEALSAAIGSPDVDVRGPDLDAPTNTGATGQSGVSVGLIEQDRNNPKALWLWAAADNFRIAVDQALDVASKVEATV